MPVTTRGMASIFLWLLYTTSDSIWSTQGRARRLRGTGYEHAKEAFSGFPCTSVSLSPNFATLYSLMIETSNIGHTLRPGNVAKVLMDENALSRRQ